MPITSNEAVGQTPAHRPQYWLAILIWVAVIAASVAAVTVTVA